MNKGDTEQGDIVITMEAPLGNIAQIPDSRLYILSQRVLLLKTQKDLVFNDFFKHQLMSDAFQSILQSRATGTTAKGIKQAKLVKLFVSIPSPPEQQRIAEILDTIDRAIARTESLIQKLKQIKAGLLHDLLICGLDENGELRNPTKHPEQFKDSPLGRIPKEWEVVTVKDIATDVTDIATDVTDGDHHTPIRSESGVFLLSARNVLNGYLALEDVDFVPEYEYARMIKRCYPEPGDILISCSGTIGRICEVPNNFRCVLGRVIN